MKKKLLLIIGLVCFSFFIKSSAQCASSNPVTSSTILTTTGVADIDNIITSENFLLKSLYNLNLDSYFYDDRQSPNAKYTSACNNNYCQGSIIFGIKLMLDQMVSEEGVESVKAILAHEWAHAYQHYWGWEGLGYQKELHADYMAGYYMGVKNVIIKQNVKAFTATFYKQGDYDFYSVSHHGTPEERSCAFLEGFISYSTRGYNLYQAYNAGIDYVQLNSPCNSFIVKKSYLTVPLTSPSNIAKGRKTIEFVRPVIVLNNQNQVLAICNKRKPLTLELPYGKYDLFYMRCNKRGNPKRWATKLGESNFFPTEYLPALGSNIIHDIIEVDSSSKNYKQVWTIRGCLFLGLRQVKILSH